MGMYAGREENKPRMSGGQSLCTTGGRGRFADTDKGPRTCCAGPLDDRVRFVSERGIGQMHMTVGKDGHNAYRVARRSALRGRESPELSFPELTARLVASGVVRGYFDSIQMSSGPAT